MNGVSLNTAGYKPDTNQSNRPALSENHGGAVTDALRFGCEWMLGWRAAKLFIGCSQRTTPLPSKGLQRPGRTLVGQHTNIGRPQVRRQHPHKKVAPPAVSINPLPP